MPPSTDFWTRCSPCTINNGGIDLRPSSLLILLFFERYIWSDHRTTNPTIRKNTKATKTCKNKQNIGPTANAFEQELVKLSVASQECHLFFCGHISWWVTIGAVQPIPIVSLRLQDGLHHFSRTISGAVTQISGQKGRQKMIILSFVGYWISRRDRVGFSNCLDLDICHHCATVIPSNFQTLACSASRDLNSRSVYPLSS